MMVGKAKVKILTAKLKNVKLKGIERGLNRLRVSKRTVRKSKVWTHK
jgi:hypothetical protein